MKKRPPSLLEVFPLILLFSLTACRDFTFPPAHHDPISCGEEIDRGTEDQIADCDMLRPETPSTRSVTVNDRNYEWKRVTQTLQDVEIWRDETPDRTTGRRRIWSDVSTLPMSYMAAEVECDSRWRNSVMSAPTSLRFRLPTEADYRVAESHGLRQVLHAYRYRQPPLPYFWTATLTSGSEPVTTDDSRSLIKVFNGSTGQIDPSGVPIRDAEYVFRCVAEE